MILFSNSTNEIVSINDIEFENHDFKISKPGINEKIRISISKNGLLELPVLLKNKNCYKIIYGHNRLSVLRQLNYKSVPSIIIDKIDSKAYAEYGILKNYRGEIGPVGKINFIRILKSLLCTDEYLLELSHVMQIPDEAVMGQMPWGNIQHLPQKLMNYIDSKDIGFKIIRNLLLLPDDGMTLLSAWVGESFRVNIFKLIVDLIFDINKRDKTLDELKQIDNTLINDRREKEEFLYKEIYKIRYPDYTEIKNNADQYINRLRENGVEINFPEYFESDEISVVLKINRRDGIKPFLKKINNIDIYALEGLLDLL